MRPKSFVAQRRMPGGQFPPGLPKIWTDPIIYNFESPAERSDLTYQDGWWGRILAIILIRWYTLGAKLKGVAGAGLFDSFGVVLLSPGEVKRECL